MAGPGLGHAGPPGSGVQSHWPLRVGQYTPHVWSAEVGLPVIGGSVRGRGCEGVRAVCVCDVGGARGSHWGERSGSWGACGSGGRHSPQRWCGPSRRVTGRGCAAERDACAPESGRVPGRRPG